MILTVQEYRYKITDGDDLNETLLLEVFVSLTVINVALFVFQLLHRLLLENFVSPFAFELLGNCRKQLYDDHDTNTRSTTYVREHPQYA